MYTILSKLENIETALQTQYRGTDSEQVQEEKKIESFVRSVDTSELCEEVRQLTLAYYLDKYPDKHVYLNAYFKEIDFKVNHYTALYIPKIIAAFTTCKKQPQLDLLNDEPFLNGSKAYLNGSKAYLNESKAYLNGSKAYLNESKAYLNGPNASGSKRPESLM